MLDDLDGRLMQAKERVRLQQKLESMMRQARDVFEEERAKCVMLEERLAQEKLDVENLEGISLWGLFYTILASKEAQLEKERQEYLAAKLKHEEAVESRDDAQGEVRRLRTELDQLMDAGSEYQRLLEEKQRRIEAAGDNRTARLLQISERLADLHADRNELGEAIQAGEMALTALEHVQKELGSAENWGAWDMMGGGMIATMMKHSKIDAAKSLARRAQRRLRRFEEELADADERLHVSIEIDGFTKFADYFFDGLIVDWVVQAKIAKASSACSTTISQVTGAVSMCRRRLVETTEELERVEAEKRGFIEEA